MFHAEPVAGVPAFEVDALVGPLVAVVDDAPLLDLCDDPQPTATSDITAATVRTPRTERSFSDTLSPHSHDRADAVTAQTVAQPACWTASNC
jgi:hypothetical protein